MDEKFKAELIAFLKENLEIVIEREGHGIGSSDSMLVKLYICEEFISSDYLP